MWQILQYNLHIRQLKPHRISTAKLSVAQHRVTNSAPFCLKQTLHGVLPHLVAIKPSKLEFLLLKNKIWNPRLLMKQNTRWSTRYNCGKIFVNHFFGDHQLPLFTVVQILAKAFKMESYQEIESFSVDKNLVAEYFKPYCILFLHFSRAINAVSHMK